MTSSIVKPMQWLSIEECVIQLGQLNISLLQTYALNQVEINLIDLIRQFSLSISLELDRSNIKLRLLDFE